MPTLLERLVTSYKGENIRYPQLREITLAQWLLESARATSGLATEHYNFGGLKWRPEMRPHATRIMYDAHDGPEAYCKFATIESFINGYWAFINRAPYSGWEEHVDSGEEFINFIGPIYCPDDGYVSQVLGLAPEARQLLSESSSNPIAVAQPQTGRLIGKIVIDPGHGGTANLPGSSANNAISFTGVKEKKLTLEFALLLEEMIQVHSGNDHTETILTRRTDVNVSGDGRAGLAGEHTADLFLSLHFNGGGSSSTRGTEAFYRAEANRNQNLEEDIRFTRTVQDAVFNALKEIDDHAVDRGAKPDTESGPGALGVLNDERLGNTPRPRKCHSSLVEIEFIDKQAVDRLLISGTEALANRRHVMDRLGAAIVDYLKEMNP